MNSSIFLLLCVGVVSTLCAETVLQITKNLDLRKEDYSEAHVITIVHTCKDSVSLDDVQVTAEIPLKANEPSPVVMVFFSDEHKYLLEVTFNDTTISGKRYKTPHARPTIMELPEGNQTTRAGATYKAKIPKSWFPRDISRISAAVIRGEEDNQEIYNYYHLQNYAISIPDLQVVEEYKKFQCGVA